MMASIPKSSLDFLTKLKKNNHRDWMTENKKEYLASEKRLKEVYAQIQQGLSKTDEIEKLKVFRINRDIRFSNDKTPYNVHRSASFSRAGAHRRGGYYLRIEPNGNSMIGGGFFGPEPADLKRIRQEFEMDASEIRAILAEPAFVKAYGGAFDAWDPVKTAPRGFNVDGPNIDLIRLKNFVVTRKFTDAQVTAPDFPDTVVAHFQLLRPFFDYMSDVLTTDLNGVSLLED
ncbi:DUF2461 domain-containing protein [Dokdonia sinensis]|uniref:DUF2461 domain-containing protein n=1 Tax=Dokdonia sinensis TaxID=2479847 RepID=A0A3M0G8T1_9FLAO|nr:DUF2461 domain-containing protein [Dokdonia sinensis]RMB57459.1 DUF2461 domain-containing protein [Dokdonia sinensis]